MIVERLSVCKIWLKYNRSIDLFIYACHCLSTAKNPLNCQSIMSSSIIYRYYGADNVLPLKDCHLKVLLRVKDAMMIDLDSAILLYSSL